MMPIVAANEPADLVTRTQGIAGATHSGSVPLGKVSRTADPSGAISIHPAGVLPKSKLTDAVQSCHVGAVCGNLGSIVVLDSELVHDVHHGLAGIHNTLTIGSVGLTVSNTKNSLAWEYRLSTAVFTVPV